MAIKDLFRIKKFKEEIEQLKDQLQCANERSHMLEHIIADYRNNVKNSTNKSISIDDFCTNEYKAKFLDVMNNKKYTQCEIVIKGNELYNKECLYFEGLVSCIDFIRHKRNPKISTEKQLLKYMFTDTGRNTLENYFSELKENVNK